MRLELERKLEEKIYFEYQKTWEFPNTTYLRLEMPSEIVMVKVVQRHTFNAVRLLKREILKKYEDEKQSKSI